MRMGSEKGFTRRNFIVCTIHVIVRVIKFRRLKSVGHEARMGGGRSALKAYWKETSGKLYV
jgi:hypothetical protein